MTLRLSVIFGADYSIFLESYVKKLLKQFLKNIPWSVFPICHILVPINCNLFDSLSFSFLGVCVCVCMCMWCCLVAESFSTLCDPMDCSPPGSSVHGILQTRILERVAISFCLGKQQQLRNLIMKINSTFYQRSARLMG